MARPRRSTQDEWLDQFADWDADIQERMLDTCALLHRQTKRRESRRPEVDTTDQTTKPQSVAPLLDNMPESEAIR